MNPLQDNLFFWVNGNPCPQPGQLNASTLEPCPFLKGYDYFQVRDTAPWASELMNHHFYRIES